MVLEKIFGGLYSICPHDYDFHLQGQGFDKEEAAKINSILRRRSLGLWGTVGAAVLAIPLSSRFRAIALTRYSAMSNQLFSASTFNVVMMASNPFYIF